jgi:hypothetical protein
MIAPKSPAKPQAATASMREVICPSRGEFICPFCAQTEVPFLGSVATI